jgi:hypothetical protein
MLKSRLLAEIQAELHRHNFDSFADEPPIVAQGGKGVVVAGCRSAKSPHVDESIHRPVK